MTKAFDSPQLVVGEVHAIRTFDLRADGLLWPVTHTVAGPWVDGPNHASCSVCESAGGNGCVCGYWAYGWPLAVLEQPAAANVAAVVSCWGRVTPGTRGVRAEHATISALWLSRRVRNGLVERVRTNYPHARIYRSRQALLRAHPLTALPGYRRWQPVRVVTRGLPRLVLAVFAAVVVGVGSLPYATLNDVLRPRPLLTAILATGIESSALMSLLSVLVASGMYARDRAVAGRLMLRVSARFAAYGLWAVSPLLVNPAATLARLPLLWIIARLVMNRALFFVPHGNRASVAVNNITCAVRTLLFGHRT